jgi:hypothetical protein
MDPTFLIIQDKIQKGKNVFSATILVKCFHLSLALSLSSLLRFSFFLLYLHN